VSYEKPNGIVLEIIDESLNYQLGSNYDDLTNKPKFTKRVLKELNAKKRKKVFEQKDIEEVLDYVLQFCLSEGRIPNTIHSKKIENLGENCYEFKSGNLRVGGFHIEPDIFLVHNFKKGTKNQQKFIQSIKQAKKAYLKGHENE